MLVGKENSVHGYPYPAACLTNEKSVYKEVLNDNCAVSLGLRESNLKGFID